MFRIKNLIKNKKAVSLPILILVLSMTALLILSLIIFYNKEKEINKEIQLPKLLNKFYIERVLLESNLNEIFESVSKDFEFSDGSEKFIEEFNKSLEIYKDKNGEYIIKGLDKIEGQIIKDNIELNKDKLVLKLNIFLENYFIEEKYDVYIKYNYPLIFEKVFK